MAQQSHRDLRQLAESFRMTFRPPGYSDQWPATHRTTFENIQTIGEQKFDSFCANIDIHSNDQPWKKQTKNRADWLAKRANLLFNQRRNEAGWRYGIENDVLRRFSFEVACPRCRARIWRSEIEAYIKETDITADQLEDRRRNRTECRCAPEHRPLDFYEVGINPLFDDRVQEVILHDPLLRAELPKQEPDRVYGLQATRNFQRLLSKPAMNSPAGSERLSVRDVVRTSPFKEGVEPLLFPFLVLEAKSERSANGFEDIQTQTALPILALLKLQEDLQAQVEESMSESGPLVWFFANRGDAWRVYSCYVTTDKPARYDVVQLWSGCITSRDDSLRLLLIVDYVFDWARDVYRPSILKQLKSLTVGGPYDKISMATDSDIFSLREKISNWIPPPLTTVSETGLDGRSAIPGTEPGSPLTSLADSCSSDGSADLEAAPKTSSWRTVGGKGPEWRGGPKYNKIARIGAGDFTFVYKIAAKFDGALYAAKEIRKWHFKKNGVLTGRASVAIDILRMTRHANIVKYLEHIDFGDYIYVVMEYASQGNLGSLISQRGHLKEPDTKIIAGQLLSALHYLHDQGITHRNIKPDNILMYTVDPFQVKLTGFSLSMTYREEEYAFSGTLLYCAPEVYLEYREYDTRCRRDFHGSGLSPPRYGNAIDIWSLAGVLFCALCGSPPYPVQHGTSVELYLNRIMTQALDVLPLQLCNISEKGIRFLQSMLDIWPDQRATTENLKHSPWLVDEDSLESSAEEADAEMVGDGSC